MLTRKHFEFIAQLLATSVDAVNALPTETPQGAAYKQGVVDSTVGMARALAVYFKAENPRFDVDRFLAAAGLKVRP